MVFRMLIPKLTATLISIICLIQINGCFCGYCLVEEKKLPTGHQEKYYVPHRGYMYYVQYDTEYRFATCHNVSFVDGKKMEIHTKTLKYIEFKNSTSSLLPVGIFADFTTLQQLYLTGMSMEEIDPGAFTGLANLEELYLQENSFNQLSKGIFNSLPRLQILNLGSNNIETIEANSFLGLFALRKLVLSNNKIQSLLDDTFKRLTVLNSLDLAHNLLCNISENIFSHINTSLSNLDLSYNNLTYINFLMFPSSIQTLNLSNNEIDSLNNWTELLSLKYLDLSNNKIELVEAVQERLTYLNLSGNQISAIAPSLFKNVKLLNTLDLSRNSIRNFSAGSFLGLSNLNYLYLQNNRFRNIPTGCLRDLFALRILNLSSNNIDEFKFGTFASLSKLENLDVSSNRLTYVDQSVFHTLKNLKVLNIDNNYITSFDPYAFLDYSKEFFSITLDKNPWICKSLLNIVNTLEKSGIDVKKGTAKTTEHVQGIACLDYRFNRVDTTSTSYLNKASLNDSNREFSQKINKLQKYLNEGFLNSSFHEYFESFKGANVPNNFSYDYLHMLQKYFDEDFKNTTFYKYFDTHNSSSFFQRLDKTLSQLTQELHSLKISLASSNKHSTDYNSEALSQYFNVFKNSSFYRYFNKDFLESEFFKYFEKNVSTNMQFDLQNIRNYFDNDFNYSAFYKIFEEHYQNLSKIFNNIDSNRNSNAQFSPYVDNKKTANADLLVSKFSESFHNLKVQERIFMILVVLILLAILCLLAFKNVRNIRFTPNIYTAATFRNDKKDKIHDDLQIELV